MSPTLCNQNTPAKLLKRFIVGTGYQGVTSKAVVDRESIKRCVLKLFRAKKAASNTLNKLQVHAKYLGVHCQEESLMMVFCAC